MDVLTEGEFPSVNLVKNCQGKRKLVDALHWKFAISVEGQSIAFVQPHDSHSDSSPDTINEMFDLRSQ